MARRTHSRSRSRSPGPRYRDEGYSRRRDYRDSPPRRSDRDRRDDRRRPRSREREREPRDDYHRSKKREYDSPRGSHRKDGKDDTQNHIPSSSKEVVRRPRSASASPSRSPSPEVDKAKPNFGHSGLLAAATKTAVHADGTTTILKYHEPPEARKPKEGWRFYVFKDAEQVDLYHVNRQSCYLFGRDRLVTDVPLDHPSCSKQHAALQYRHVQTKDEWGEVKGIVKPFIIDLDSTNGTHVNGERIPPSRYYELKVNDVLTFGQSAREYVLLHDNVA